MGVRKYYLLRDPYELGARDFSCDSVATSTIPLPGVEGGDNDDFLFRILASLLVSLLFSLWVRQRLSLLSTLLQPLLAKCEFFVWSRSFRCRRIRGVPALPLGGAQSWKYLLSHFVARFIFYEPF